MYTDVCLNVCSMLYIECLEPALNREVHSMKWNVIILKFNSCKTLKSSCQKNVSLKSLEISQRFQMLSFIYGELLAKD